MTAAGTGHVRLTVTETGQASSQPSWLPDGRGILFRRSGPGRVSTIWQMGVIGQNPALRFAPPHPPLYQSFAPDQRRIAYAAILSPTGDTDRGIFTLDVDGSGPTTLFDVPGAYDSAPAWSPDGTRIAFESNADVAGANPERDMEVWVMQRRRQPADAADANAAHDEGPAWSPDGRLLAYTSGPDEKHGDIHVMPAAGRRRAPADGLRERRRVARLAGDPGAAHGCALWWAGRAGAGRRRVRCAGGGTPADVRCGARALVRRWLATQRPRRVRGYARP